MAGWCARDLNNPAREVCRLAGRALAGGAFAARQPREGSDDFREGIELEAIELAAQRGTAGNVFAGPRP